MFRIEHKGYFITANKNTPNIYSISTTGKGGTIPDSLSGMYNDRNLAKIHIDRYIDGKNKKGLKNAETIFESGD